MNIIRSPRHPLRTRMGMITPKTHFKPHTASPPSLLPRNPHRHSVNPPRRRLQVVNPRLSVSRHSLLHLANRPSPFLRSANPRSLHLHLVSRLLVRRLNLHLHSASLPSVKPLSPHPSSVNPLNQLRPSANLPSPLPRSGNPLSVSLSNRIRLLHRRANRLLHLGSRPLDKPPSLLRHSGNLRSSNLR
jgi:hypothetical protein